MGVACGEIADGDRVTYWESVARTKWGSYITAVEKRVILKAHDLCPRPTNALEVGCDGGRWSRLLADLGWIMTCTDIYPDELGLCQQRIPQAKCVLVKEEDTSLPCKSGTMDLILCVEVPVLSSEWFLPEAFRVLKECGMMVGVGTNRSSLRGLVKHLICRMKQRSEDYYGCSYPEWRARICGLGFDVLHEEGLCWFPFKRDSNSPLIPLCTRLEHHLGLRRLPAISPWIVYLAQRKEKALRFGRS